ncbi:MAG: hypothetical protein U1F46_11310 [Marinagarivorans sp.]
MLVEYTVLFWIDRVLGWVSSYYSGVLLNKIPSIKWTKDRGANVSSAP